MADYVTVTDPECEPEAPLTSSLVFRLRDNAIAIAEGAVGAPRVHPRLVVRDVKTVGTVGGSGSSGVFVTRTINTVVLNEISGASLSGNQITLPAGKYEIEASVPASGNIQGHSAKLYNVTAAADVLFSASQRGVANINTIARICAPFELAATSVLEIRHQVVNSASTSDLGTPASVGSISEIYTDVTIRQIGKV